MPKPRNTWIYELKDGNKIVYYGKTNDPERRVPEHAAGGKKFTHHRVISVALTEESAEQREAEEIQRYQSQHGGSPPKYNIYKTY